MHLELPQRLPPVDKKLGSSIAKNSDTEELQSSVPEFILSAIGNFKEGREYFECGNFQTARNKFLCSIRNLAWECPSSPLDDEEPAHFCVQNALEYVENFLASSHELIRTLCRSPITVDLQKICLPSASHIDRITVNEGEEMSMTMNIFVEDPEFEGKLKGIICAILCDTISALANCEEVLGRYSSARELHAALVKLQKLLYGDEVIHGAISLRSLARFFDALGCHPDEDVLTAMEIPYNVCNANNADRFNAAKDPSQNEMEQNDINDCEDAFSFFASFE